MLGAFCSLSFTQNCNRFYSCLYHSWFICLFLFPSVSNYLSFLVGGGNTYTFAVSPLFLAYLHPAECLMSFQGYCISVHCILGLVLPLPQLQIIFLCFPLILDYSEIGSWKFNLESLQPSQLTFCLSCCQHCWSAVLRQPLQAFVNISFYALVYYFVDWLQLEAPFLFLHPLHREKQGHQV